MVQENVISFHKPDKEFPDWFPKSSYLEAAVSVSRSVPDKVSEAHYDYALKRHLGIHHPCAVILQPGGSVLFNAIKHVGENARMQNWVKSNVSALKQIATNRDKTVTVVGKVNGAVFTVYYVIEEGLIFFDTYSISARIWGHLKLLDGTLVVEPIMHPDAALIVNHAKGTVSMSHLSNIQIGEHVMGVPVTIENREDAVSEPRLFTTVERMRFFSFTYQGA